jgi:hypothetical protein
MLLPTKFSAPTEDTLTKLKSNFKKNPIETTMEIIKNYEEKETKEIFELCLFKSVENLNGKSRTKSFFSGVEMKKILDSFLSIKNFETDFDNKLKDIFKVEKTQDAWYIIYATYYHDRLEGEKVRSFGIMTKGSKDFKTEIKNSLSKNWKKIHLNKRVNHEENKKDSTPQQMYQFGVKAPQKASINSEEEDISASTNSEEEDISASNSEEEKFDLSEFLKNEDISRLFGEFNKLYYENFTKSELEREFELIVRELRKVFFPVRSFDDKKTSLKTEGEKLNGFCSFVSQKCEKSIPMFERIKIKKYLFEKKSVEEIASDWDEITKKYPKLELVFPSSKTLLKFCLQNLEIKI